MSEFMSGIVHVESQSLRTLIKANHNIRPWKDECHLSGSITQHGIRANLSEFLFEDHTAVFWKVAERLGLDMRRLVFTAVLLFRRCGDGAGRTISIHSSTG